MKHAPPEDVVSMATLLSPGLRAWPPEDVVSMATLLSPGLSNNPSSSPYLKVEDQVRRYRNTQIEYRANPQPRAYSSGCHSASVICLDTTADLDARALSHHSIGKEFH